MCKKVEEHIPIENLQHYDQLRFFPDIIEANFAYKFGAQIVYRTVRNNPPEESDFIPLTYQEVSGVKKVEVALSQTLVDKMSGPRKYNAVSDRALSINDTLEHSIEKARESYQRFLAKGHTPEEAEAYKQKRGTFVTKLRITPDLGIVTRFTDGHAEFLPYEGAITKILEACEETTPFEYEEINETEE